MRKVIKNVFIMGTVLAVIYSVLKVVARKTMEDESIDNDNPYIRSDAYIEDNVCSQSGIYGVKIKPVLDQILSFVGLVVLSPLLGLISLAVYIDDPGPVFFIQKRVGKGGRFFMIHKYRSMRMNAPHDIPTHQLSDPEKHITHIGEVLRKTSLDELPQLWDIFRQKMSVIGPRPALWNQGDLVAERDKYGANSVMPGLTGLAQIKGRDELELAEKARIDGEYTSSLSFATDCKCFFGTVKRVICHDGVIEGGTGKIRKKLGL